MRITRVFLDVDLRQSFDGLREMAKKAKTDLLGDTTVLFINHARTKFKILRSDTYLIYYTNGNRRIPLDAIRYLPKMFSGSRIEMDAAVKDSLRLKLNLVRDQGTPKE